MIMRLHLLLRYIDRGLLHGGLLSFILLLCRL